MITSIFPNKIVIKDYDLSDTWNTSVTLMLKNVFATVVADKTDYAAAGNDSVPVFTEENMHSCPELAHLKQMFVDNFFELANSYSNNQLTQTDIEKRLKADGRLPFMRKHDFKSVHTHESYIDAFGIFYLTEVDNANNGGELILHDPSFSGMMHFHESKTYRVATKKHRMVVCPNHIWHEVSQYHGDQERIAIVLNLAGC
jgi:hypothetical protein